MPKFPTTTKWPSSASWPPSGIFDIIPLSAIVEWWRSDLSVDQGSTLSWTGQKAGVVLSQGTAASKPAYGADAAFNGRPSFTADGTNDSLNSTLTVPAPGTTPRYYWFIFKVTSASTPATTNSLFCGKTNICEEVAQLNTTGQLAGYNGTALTTALAANTSARMGEAYFSNSTSDRFSIGTNPSNSVTGVNTGNTQDASGWGLFSRGGTDSFFSGSLAEILIMNRDRTAAEFALLSQYAASLYTATVLT